MKKNNKWGSKTISLDSGVLTPEKINSAFEASVKNSGKPTSILMHTSAITKLIDYQNRTPEEKERDRILSEERQKQRDLEDYKKITNFFYRFADHTIDVFNDEMFGYSIEVKKEDKVVYKSKDWEYNDHISLVDAIDSIMKKL